MLEWLGRSPHCSVLHVSRSRPSAGWPWPWHVCGSPRNSQGMICTLKRANCWTETIIQKFSSFNPFKMRSEHECWRKRWGWTLVRISAFFKKLNYRDPALKETKSSENILENGSYPHFAATKQTSKNVDVKKCMNYCSFKDMSSQQLLI